MKIASFWLSLNNEYKELSERAKDYLMPFATTYLREKAYSYMY